MKKMRNARKIRLDRTMNLTTKIYRNRPWKSGPSRAASAVLAVMAFRPRVSRLKPLVIRTGERGAEAPLFHGHIPPALIKHLVLLIACAFSISAPAQVTFERLLNSAKEPQNWMTYSGDYSGKRFSGLDQINTTNASKITAKWVYQTGATGKIETTPLVVNGILYATAQDDRAFALDARTGRPIWMYQRQLPGDIRPCCGRVNRGVAILGDKVFLGTLDAHLIALDAKTGNVVWDVNSADYSTGHSFTVAPLAVKNLIIIGISGGEYGVRGFIDAYDADSGERKWRLYTVPGPGEPGHDSWAGDSWKVGGAPAWNTGTYDPATNQLFWPTGNPSPSNRGEGREGDNLYSNSLLAINADTGKLNWHFQFTKHDEHDWDPTQIPILIDKDGKKLIAQANRNGFFYVLDRTNGKLISATAYGKQTWSDTKDAEGRPIAKKEASPTLEGHTVCPGALGTTNWYPPAYDPQTGLFYVTSRDQCDIFSTAPQPYEAGHAFYGSAYFPSEEARPYFGFLKAIDPATGEVKWKFQHTTPTWSGVLSTAGGLVFSGDAEGNFIAFDAASGKPLWHFQMGSAVYAAPMAFAVDGKEYLAIASGSAIYAFGLP
ncbi:MAG TPA: PQQ-dependent dehydrogenase, methanol/ethanol family [Candidatus Solibacter sp.]|nr:PQQ-dependent dehydrogenase, methanol/ethanol family [Candidatus Solibacter sp.]